MAGDGRQQPVQPQSFLPDISLNLDVDTQNLLQAMKSQIQNLAGSPTPPGVPVGLSATAETLGNLIKWSAVPTADSYRVYRNSTNSFATAVVVQQLAGNANTSWYDPFQAAAAAGLYYWVAALSASGVPGPTSAMLTIMAGINVNDIFAQNITATGTITGATLQTATSGARIVIDSTNGLRAINGSNVVVMQADLSGNFAVTGGVYTGGTMTAATVQTASSGARVVLDSTNGLRAINGSAVTVFQADLSGNVSLTGTVQTASTNGRVVIDPTNGLRCYDSGGVLQVQVGVGGTVPILGGVIKGITGDLVLQDHSTNGQITVSNALIDFFMNGGARMQIDSAVTIYSANLVVSNGYGIASGGTSFACASTAQIYQSSTKVFDIGTSTTQIYIAGTMYTLSVVAGVVHAA